MTHNSARIPNEKNLEAPPPPPLSEVEDHHSLDLLVASGSAGPNQQAHAISAPPTSFTTAVNPPLTSMERLHALPLPLRNLLAGGCAGMVAKSVVAPLDRIKILYQVSTAEFHFSSLPRVAANIVRTEGLSALWQGNTATMIRVFPYSGIQFMIFDRIKTHFLQEHEHGRHYDSLASMVTTPVATTLPTTTNTNNTSLLQSNHNTAAAAAKETTTPTRIRWGLTPLESLVAGMAAGTISVIVTYPLDLTRAQLAVFKKTGPDGKCPGFMRVLADNYQRRGVVGGLFRGISPTLTGILPYAGISFALNEQTKREIHHLTGRDLTTVERMQSGAFAGLVAQTLTYPIEVVRRRMQTIGMGLGDSAVTNLGVVVTSGETAARLKQPQQPPTNWMVISSLYAEQGVKGFFKGVSMNWMKGPVAFSISFTTFDSIQRFMESEEEQQRRLPGPSRSS